MCKSHDAVAVLNSRADLRTWPQEQRRPEVVDVECESLNNNEPLPRTNLVDLVRAW
jgi:capsule polysaccharide modification protein KpsS